MHFVNLSRYAAFYTHIAKPKRKTRVSLSSFKILEVLVKRLTTFGLNEMLSENISWCGVSFTAATEAQYEATEEWEKCMFASFFQHR